MTDARDPSGDAPARRKFLGVMYECCSVYARAYIHRDGTHYAGRCPRCGRAVRFRVDARGEGSDRRFWRAR